MTTAAYQRGVLAADTCYTHSVGEEPIFRTRATKISVVKGKDFTVAIVIAGYDCLTAAYEQAVVKAFTAAVKVDQDLPGDLRLELELENFPNCIAMFRIGNRSGAYSGENVLRLVPVNEYVAIGSDAGIALGALHSGAGAIRAVQAAAHHGIMTAGPIESLCSTFFNVTTETSCT